jgi:hypothetical protein
MKKIVNGNLVDMTADEISQKNAEDTAWLASQPSPLEVAMETLRAKRNKLLADTDYLALSDQTLSPEMSAYRQALRDITNGLTTKDEVEAVVFPTKP